MLSSPLFTTLTASADLTALQRLVGIKKARKGLLPYGLPVALLRALRVPLSSRMGRWDMVQDASSLLGFDVPSRQPPFLACYRCLVLWLCFDYACTVNRLSHHVASLCERKFETRKSRISNYSESPYAGSVRSLTLSTAHDTSLFMCTPRRILLR